MHSEETNLTYEENVHQDNCFFSAIRFIHSVRINFEIIYQYPECNCNQGAIFISKIVFKNRLL